MPHNDEYTKKARQLKPKVEAILTELHGTNGEDAIGILTFVFGCVLSQMDSTTRMVALLKFHENLPTAVETAEKSIEESIKRN